VILDIFRDHAQRPRARIQVELPQLEYNLARQERALDPPRELGGGSAPGARARAPTTTNTRLLDRPPPPWSVDGTGSTNAPGKPDTQGHARGDAPGARKRAGTAHRGNWPIHNAGTGPTCSYARTGAEGAVRERIFRTIDPNHPPRSRSPGAPDYLVNGQLGLSFRNKLPPPVGGRLLGHDREAMAPI